jgi:hypothetical protein
MIDQVVPGLWHWSIQRHGLPTTMNAYALRDGENTILVDPLVGRPSKSPVEELIEELDAIVRGSVRIFLTTPFHVRGADVLQRRWGGKHEISIYGHQNCARQDRLTDLSAFRPLSGGEELEGAVRVHTISKPKRAEMPVELGSHRALAIGDSIVEIDGELRVWENLERPGRREWYEQKLMPTLEALAALESEWILPTHGAPVLQDGARELRATLERPPWDRPPQT